jgi:hypothetical protein
MRRKLVSMLSGAGVFSAGLIACLALTSAPVGTPVSNGEAARVVGGCVGTDTWMCPSGGCNWLCLVPLCPGATVIDDVDHNDGTWDDTSSPSGSLRMTCGDSAGDCANYWGDSTSCGS